MKLYKSILSGVGTLGIILALGHGNRLMAAIPELTVNNLTGSPIIGVVYLDGTEKIVELQPFAHYMVGYATSTFSGDFTTRRVGMPEITDLVRLASQGVKCSSQIVRSPYYTNNYPIIDVYKNGDGNLSAFCVEIIDY